MGSRRARLRATLVLTAVVAATLAGGLLALTTFRQDRDLDAGTVRVSVVPGAPSGLALYVPLVDWGVRFDAVRLPAQLRVDVRRIDRAALGRVAEQRQLDVRALRAQARDAIAGYLRALVIVVFAAALLAGALVALALRSGDGPRLRWSLGCAVATALSAAGAVALLLPPRGALEDPEYFAHGSDIPAALRAVEAVGRSERALSEELDAQLVGLARLVVAPGRIAPTRDAPRLTLASDVHNNVLVLPALRRIAHGGPLFVAGDLTDRGSPLEASATRSIARAGDPLVFVSGNHDSAVLQRDLARAGAIVLTRRGRLLPDGRHGPRVVRVGRLRVAGYDDPFLRRPGQASAPDPQPSAAQQAAFDDWLRSLGGDLDVVLVHEPALAAVALERLAADPPPRPLAFLVGHTHVPSLQTTRNVLVLNGGTAGGGGTGNLAESQPIGLAVLSYETDPTFDPLAADLIEIDPANGDATATRRRLDLDDEATLGDAALDGP
ncbi:MAG TPA: metallophosphoesterase [Conexibacter sp.]|nr:metallophosphoesterase [Conexibacter sp.]